MHVCVRVRMSALRSPSTRFVRLQGEQHPAGAMSERVLGSDPQGALPLGHWVADRAAL